MTELHDKCPECGEGYYITMLEEYAPDAIEDDFDTVHWSDGVAYCHA